MLAKTAPASPSRDKKCGHRLDSVVTCHPLIAQVCMDPPGTQQCTHSLKSNVMSLFATVSTLPCLFDCRLTSMVEVLCCSKSASQI
jgi:hypothetical protein